MTQPLQETLRFSRVVDAPPADVWAAWADSDTRARWSVPEGEAQVFHEDDLRTGGRAAYSCGDPDALQFSGEVGYVLVDPGSAIVHTETVSTQGRPLSVSVLTWRFVPAEEGTRVEVVDQVTSLVGQDMIDGHRNGHTTALEQLDRLLRGR